MNGIIKYLILILLITLPFQVAATAAQPDDSAGKNKVDWINKSFFVGQELVDPNCIEVPKLTSFHTDSIDLDLSASGTWVPTHVTVAKDKMIKFNWTTKGIKPRPRKYLVLYRIDPRFEKPQLFIQTWDYTQKKYVTDFPKSNSAFADYQKYFNDTARKALKVNTGDVINITLVDPIVFFNSSSNIFADELNPQPLKAEAAYTPSNIDNKILYSESEYFCNIIDPSRNSLCSGTGTNTKYLNRDKFAAVGRLMQKGFEANYTSLKPCPLSSKNNKNNPACFYDQGRGLKVQLNNTIIKEIYPI